MKLTVFKTDGCGCFRWWVCAILVGLVLDAAAVAQRTSLADLAERQNWQALAYKLAPNESVADQPAVDRPQSDGTTALHWAVFHGDLKTTRQLLDCQANPNSLNKYQVSPLSVACELGHGQVARLLVDSGADVNQARLGRETPLMLASRAGDSQIVAVLLQAGADCDAKEVQGQTALMWAAAAGHVDVIKQLIAAEVDVTPRLKSGFDPLMFAARNGQGAAVRCLCDNGFDINAVMNPANTKGRHARKGMGPLLLAIESGHLELALDMITWGADPNDQRSGYAALHAISWVRRPNRGDDIAGDPPPRITGNIDSLEFVRQLVQSGADVNLQLERGKAGGKARLNPRGATPFLLASAAADLPLMQLLLELGADPTINNADDCTPLMAAAGVGVIAVDEFPGSDSEICFAIQLLHQRGVDINHRDANGETAMHGAAYRTFPKVVSALGQLGADPQIWNQPNRHGWTPFDIAKGKRPGSVKPSPATARALQQAMITAD